MALTALYIAVRIPLLDHPLSWDEAWILNALKSLVDKSNTGFSDKLRRHPPLYLGLGLAFFPNKPDFTIRMQILSLIINTGAFLFFILLVAKIFHRRIAIYSGIAYSLLPGSILYSTWIKRDSLVILFSMAALWAFFNRKYFLTGFFLAIGFLSKETAVFYAAGIFLMTPFQHSKKSTIRILAEIFIPVIIVSAWWYFFFANSTKGFFSFFKGTSEEANLFVQPWWYYWAMLKDDLGWPGLLLFGTGLLVLLPARKSYLFKIKSWNFLKKKRLLPLFMILPGYLLLSLSHGKPPWMTVVLYPFLALLVGLGWHLITKISANFTTKASSKNIYLYNVIAIFPLILILGFPVVKFNYMHHLSKISPGTSNVIIRSYRIAEAINTSTTENEKLLILPMIIQPALGTQPDPIIFWNLKPSLKVYRAKTLNLDYNAVKDIIIQQQIQWLLIFPVAGSNQLAITEKIINESDPVGLNLPGMTLLLKVDQYWKN